MQSALRLLDRDMMDKQRALDAALGQIERAFGKGSIMKLGSREAASDVDVVSTGSLGLDIALGIGGLPRGRVVEIYGPERDRKSTRLNSSHLGISYAVFCLKKKKNKQT